MASSTRSRPSAIGATRSTQEQRRSDLEEALLAVGLSVETSRSSITTASGVYDVVLHTAERVTDDTTTGVGRRSVLGATALAFAPRAHAVEADPRTDIKARADYVEKEAQDQRLPDIARKRAQGRARTDGRDRLHAFQGRRTWSKLITSAASSTAACLTGGVLRGDAWEGRC